MEGGKFTPFKEIRKVEVIGSLGVGSYYIYVPVTVKKFFPNRVKMLFDPQKNLLALQPSEDPVDNLISNGRICCTQFIREYRIPPQRKMETYWDPKNKYLIAKIER